jgi:hypothetical protein
MIFKNFLNSIQINRFKKRWEKSKLFKSDKEIIRNQFTNVYFCYYYFF